MANNTILIVLFCIFVLSALTNAEGTVFVDTVFSSSESKITIDNLTGENAETTSVSSHEVEFEAFQQLSVSAPGLGFSGAFVSVTGTNDVKFTSTNDTVSLTGGHNFDINAFGIQFNANDFDIFSSGELLLLARGTTQVSGANVGVSVGHGGISFSSLAGSIELDSSQSLSFDSNAALTVHSDNNLQVGSSGNSIFTGSNMYAMSENHFSVDSSTSISLVSSTQGVRLDSHDLAMTLGSLSANGGGQALIQSLGDEVNVFGYLGLDLNSFGDINIVGESDGAHFISSGPTDGASFTSTSGSATFTANGASDESEVHLEATNINAQASKTIRINSGGSTVLTGDKNVEFDAGSVDFQIRRDAFVFNEHQMSFTAGSSFTTQSDLLLLDASSDVTANDAAGSIVFSALLVDVDVGNFLSMTGGGYLFEAGQSDIEMDIGGDLTFQADFTDGRNQEVDMEARNVFFNGGDFFIKGGDVVMFGEDQIISSANDLDVRATYETESSYVSFHSIEEQDWDVATWSHTSGNTLFGANNLVDDSSAEFQFVDATLTSNGKDNIIFESSKMLLESSDDIDFEIRRDLTVSSEGDMQFTSTGKDITIETSDFFGSAERLDIDAGDGSTDDHDLVFDIGRHFILTTDRNEATDDIISFAFTDDITLNLDSLILTAGTETEVIGQDIKTSSDDLIFGSGAVNNFNFDVGAFEFIVENDYIVNGNSLEIISDVGDISFDANHFEALSASRGVEIISDGSFSITVDDLLSIDTSDELLFQSTGPFALLAGDGGIATIASELLSFNTKNGNVEFVTGADLSVRADRNMTISTGDDFGDTLLIDSGKSTVIDADDIFAFVVTDGPITMTTTESEVTLGTSSLDIEAGGTYSFSSATITLSSGSSDLTGGDIDFLTTTGNLHFESGGLTEILSADSSIAGEEFDSNRDGISFTSATSSIQITNEENDVFFTSNGDVSMVTEVGLGSISIDANDVRIASDGENQDIISTTEGKMTVETLNRLSMTVDSDFMMTAANGLSFTQSDFLVRMDSDLLTISELGSILINHEGDSVFGVTVLGIDFIGADTERDNVVQFDSVQKSTFTSQGGISFASVGHSEARRDQNGDSNSHQQLEQSVGFSARTYEPLGHIIFDSRSSDISLDANKNMILDTDQTMLIDTFEGQSWSARQQLIMESEDGGIHFAGALGIDIEVERGSTYFTSHQYTNVFADRDISYTADDTIDIRSFHADIEATSFNNADILVNAGRFSKLTAGSELNVFSQGDLLFTADDEFTVIADRGFSLTASGELISFISTESNEISSSEEINFQAGGDFLIENAGQAAQNMKFTGNGIVFSTTGGDMEFNVGNDITFNFATMLIHGFGSSAGGRDNVQFTAPDTSFTADRDILVDATEAVRLGFSTNPSIVTFSGVGSDDFPGVRVTSVGNIELDSDSDFVGTADDFNTNSIAQTSFTAGQLFSFVSAAGDITVEAKEGVIALKVAEEFTHTIADTIRFTGGFQNTYKTGDILYDTPAGTFRAEGGEFVNLIEGDFTSISTGGEALFQSSKEDGTLDFDIDTLFMLTSITTFDITADDLISFNIEDKTTFDIEDQTTFDLQNFASQLNFDSVDAMSFDFATDITLNSVVSSFQSGMNSITFSSEGVFDLDAGHEIHGTVGSTFRTTSDGDGIYDVIEGFRVLADASIAVQSTTTIDVVTSSTQFITQPGGESDISSTIGGDLSISGFPTEEVVFRGEEEFEFEFATSDISAADLTFVSTGERSDVTVDTPSLNFNDLDSSTIIAGDFGSSGSVVFTGATIVMTIAEDLTFLADAQDISSTSSVDLRTDTTFTLTSTNDVTFSASSDTEGQQGTIELVVSEADGVLFVSSSVGDIDIQARKSSVQIDSLGTGVNGDTTFDATETFTANTHGTDAGINIESDFVTLPIFTGDVSLVAGHRFEYISEDQSILSVQSLGNLNIDTTGPAATSGAGVRFRTEEDDGRIGFTSDTTIDFVSASDFNNVATDNIQMTGTSGTFTSPEFEFRAQGISADDGSSGNNVGIDISSGTLTLNPDTDVLFQTASDFTYDATTLVSTVTGDMYFRSSGHVELNFDIGGNGDYIQTAPTGDIVVTSGYGGIQIASPSTLDLVAGGDMFFDAGIGEENSVISFGDGSFNNNILIDASDDLDFESQGNTLVTGYSTVRYTAEDSIQFTATKGDMLFRSVTSSGSFRTLFLTGTEEVVISAFERIEHRQHDRLAFFDVPSQPRPSASGRDTDSSQQRTTTIPGFAGDAFRDGCGCDAGRCGNVECPENTNRILQMQDAFIDYGLLAAV